MLELAQLANNKIELKWPYYNNRLYYQGDHGDLWEFAEIEANTQYSQSFRTEDIYMDFGTIEAADIPSDVIVVTKHAVDLTNISSVKWYHLRHLWEPVTRTVDVSGLSGEYFIRIHLAIDEALNWDVVILNRLCVSTTKFGGYDNYNARSGTISYTSLPQTVSQETYKVWLE